MRYTADVQGQMSRSQRKVVYQQQKRYNTAMDRFSDVKLGSARHRKFVIRAGKGWRGSGGLKLQCIRNSHVFEFNYEHSDE